MLECPLMRPCSEISPQGPPQLTVMCPQPVTCVFDFGNRWDVTARGPMLRIFIRLIGSLMRKMLEAAPLLHRVDVWDDEARDQSTRLDSEVRNNDSVLFEYCSRVADRYDY